MRRKPGQLLAIERAILDAALELRRSGSASFHGFMMATRLKDHGDPRTLTAYGTLYKALDRLERAGLLSSRWEDPAIAERESRPRRRLYEVTAAGEVAAVAAPVPAGGVVPEAAR